jgi:hypothetical protein
MPTRGRAVRHAAHSLLARDLRADRHGRANQDASKHFPARFPETEICQISLDPP